MRKTSDIHDEWLVLQCQSGDKKAFSILIDKWNSKLLSQAYYQMRDQEGAKDVVQDAWTSALKSIHKLKDPAKLSSWLYRIVYLKSVDWIRNRQKDRKGLGQGWEVESELNNANEESDEENISRILRALSDMNEGDRMVIRLFYLDGQSIKNISQILNIPLGSVKSKLFYAREHLKKLIKSKSYEQEQ